MAMAANFRFITSQRGGDMYLSLMSNYRTSHIEAIPHLSILYIGYINHILVSVNSK